MIRFEKGLGDHYRMAVPRKAAMTQAAQDALVEGDWVVLIADTAGTLAFGALPTATQGGGISAAVGAAPLVSNPATPDHAGPYVPLAVGVGKADVIYTDRYDTSALAATSDVAGKPIVARSLTVGGVVVNGVDIYRSAPDDIPARAVTATTSEAGETITVNTPQAFDPSKVIGTGLGINTDGELFFLWNGR